MDNLIEVLKVGFSKEELNTESLNFNDKALLSSFEGSGVTMLNMPCGGECFCA